MRHRRDIDGLRAVALAPVVLFHAGVSFVSGGFVGVDIFFVISGFLIGSIIIRDVDNGAFSIIAFYERRFRRIIPALIVVACFSAIVGYLTMLPEQFTNLGKAIAATSVFVSNIFFWRESGYFAPAAEWMPLLHTWSLAVEEQFYILFPLIVLALAGRGRKTLAALIGAAFLLSFVLSVYTSYKYPSAAFFLIPARAWELLLGVLIALPRAGIPIPQRWFREILSSVGLLLILGAVFTIDTQTVFPGFAAIAPCLGAAFIIVAGQSGPSLTTSLLETAPFVGLGLISYSLYLWHWPILVFLRLRLVSIGLPPWLSAIAVVAAIAISAFSWRFIERPFRTKGVFSRGQIYRFAGLSMSGALAAAGLILATAGMPWRFSTHTLAVARASTDIDPLRDVCEFEHTDSSHEPCTFGGAPVTPVTYALWGDSHAAAMRPAIAKAMEMTSRKGTLFWNAACPPYSARVWSTSLATKTAPVSWSMCWPW